MAQSIQTSFDVTSAVPALRRYALTLTRHLNDAEDLVHDTILRAIERKGTFEAGGNVLSWLMTILHNLHIDQLRARQSGLVREKDFVEQHAANAGPTQLDSVRLEQVRRAFGLLPDEQRVAMELVAIEGMSYEEAGRALGVPIGTVMSRISRGRLALRAWEERGSVLS